MVCAYLKIMKVVQECAFSLASHAPRDNTEGEPLHIFAFERFQPREAVEKFAKVREVPERYRRHFQTSHGREYWGDEARKASVKGYVGKEYGSLFCLLRRGLTTRGIGCVQLEMVYRG